MSVWPSQVGRRAFRPPVSARNSLRFKPLRAFAVLAFGGFLAAQGVAVTQSYLWAAPVLCLLFVAMAVDIPLVPFVGVLLVVRVLTDDLSSATSRHSASVNLSAAIAGLFILTGVGLLIRRRQAVGPALVAGLWLCLWTAIAVNTDGASTVTLREGVREASLVALAVIVCNSRGVLNVALVTRLIQIAGILSALVALYQLGTHTGQLVGGHIRSNGTFSQPNSAAVFFAVATMASIWRFLNDGRRRLDAAFVALYAAGTIATFSLGGLGCLLVMLIVFGILRPGSIRIKLGSLGVAALIIIAFVATPLGAERIESESSTTNLSTIGIRGASNSSLGWRLFKWKTLIPEWERAPLFGKGLGTTIISEATLTNGEAAALPHSELVRYLVETGAVGLLTLLSGLALLIRRLSRQIATTDARETRILALAVLIGLLVNALVANTLLYTPAAYAAAMIVTAGLASPSEVRRHVSRGAYHARSVASFV
jgi:O-antigen ligase